MYIIELDVELRYSPIKSGKSQISNLSVYQLAYFDTVLLGSDQLYS